MIKITNPHTLIIHGLIIKRSHNVPSLSRVGWKYGKFFRIFGLNSVDLRDRTIWSCGIWGCFVGWAVLCGLGVLRQVMAGAANALNLAQVMLNIRQQ
jgi:hypothetical protein